MAIREVMGYRRKNIKQMERQESKELGLCLPLTGCVTLDKSSSLGLWFFL